MLKKRTIENILTFFLLLVSIGIASGPVFMFLYAPDLLLGEERLKVGSFLTPYTIATFFAAAIACRKFGSYWFWMQRNVIPLIGLLLVLFVSSFIYTRGGSLSGLNISFLGAILFYVSATGVMREYPNALKYVVYSYVLTSIGISVLYLFLVGGPFVSIGAGRYFFLGENPNSYSTRMAISVILSLFSFQNFDKKWKYAVIASLVPQLVIIYLSGSRGAILMLAVALLLFLLSKDLSLGQKVGYSIVIAVFALGLSIYRTDHHSVEGDLIDRMVSLVEKGETAGRGDLWEQAWEIFSDSPILGVGQVGFTEEMLARFNEPRDVHNLYLFLLASGGIVGLCCFLGFLLPLIFSCWKNRAQDALPLGLVLAILLFTFKSGGILSYSLMWLVFAIITSLTKNKQWIESNKH